MRPRITYCFLLSVAILAIACGSNTREYSWEFAPGHTITVNTPADWVWHWEPKPDFDTVTWQKPGDQGDLVRAYIFLQRDYAFDKFLRVNRALGTEFEEITVSGRKAAIEMVPRDNSDVELPWLYIQHSGGLFRVICPYGVQWPEEEDDCRAFYDSITITPGLEATP